MALEPRRWAWRLPWGIFHSLIFFLVLPPEPYAQAGAPPKVQEVPLDGPGFSGLIYTGSNTGEFLNAGFSLAGNLDFDGDFKVNRKADFLIGAPGAGLEGPAGRVFLIRGKAPLSSPVPLGAPPEGVVPIVTGENAPDRFGAAVAGLGDVDGDGFDDVLMGAPGGLGRNFPGGSAFLLFGSANPPPVMNLLQDLRGRGLVFASLAPGEEAGAAVAGIGDVDGDGFPDLAIAAPRAQVGLQLLIPAGRVYVIFGGPQLRKLEPLVVLQQLQPPLGWALDGIEKDGLLGASLAAAADLDGDQLNDFAVGSPGGFSPQGLPGAGKVFLIFGDRTLRDRPPPDLSRPPVLPAPAYVTLILNAPVPGAMLGGSVGGGRQVTGDPHPDLLLGLPEFQMAAGGPRTGLAILLPGGPDLRRRAATDLSQPRPGQVALLGAPGSRAGFAVALVQDASGDAFGELLIGAPGSANLPGKAFLVRGAPQLPPEIDLEALPGDLGTVYTHAAPGSSLGWAVADLGDRNEDGRSELALGAPSLLSASRENGAVFEIRSVVAPPGPPPPEDLACAVLPERRVRLSWVSKARYQSLAILRDGKVLAGGLPGDLLYYIDSLATASLLEAHRYEVEANGKPELTSRPCEVTLTSLPVRDLDCDQIPGTTRVRASWRAGDQYQQLAAAVDGQEVQRLSGAATEVELALKAGAHLVEIYDPQSQPAGVRILASCKIEVLAVVNRPIPDLNCQVLPAAAPLSVLLQWTTVAGYSGYEIARDGVLLAVLGVEGRFVDAAPPPGDRTYTVTGLVGEVHRGPPATCPAAVPPPGAGALRGRVFWNDAKQTPLGRGQVSFADGQGISLGFAQIDPSGRFAFLAAAGGPPATALFEAVFPDLPSLPTGQRPDRRLAAAVKIPAVLKGDLSIPIPLPVLAISGEIGGASRWLEFSSAAESNREAGGLPQGILVFPASFQGGLAPGARKILAHQRKVVEHLQHFLGAAPAATDLVAHGATGFSARLFLNESPQNARPVRKLVLLGTANLGSRLSELAYRASFLDFDNFADDNFAGALLSLLGMVPAGFLETAGAEIHLVAGTAGSDFLDPLLGCAEHDNVVCVESALGGVPGAMPHRTADTHAQLGRSPASIDLLLKQILLPPGGAAAGPGGGIGGGEEVLEAGGGGNGGFLVRGQGYDSVILISTSQSLDLLSDTTGSIIIILNNRLPGQLQFKIETPSGSTIDSTNAGPLPNVEYLSHEDDEGNLVQAYEFTGSEVGVYHALLDNLDAGTEISYSVQIYLESAIGLSVALEPDSVHPNEAAVIKATLKNGNSALTGAAVNGRVNRPDGGYENMALHDDGAGGDALANDGIYTVSFGGTASSGMYLVTVSAQGSSPLSFIREESAVLQVQSEAARFKNEFVSGVEDSEPNGDYDDLWVEGKVEIFEAGTYLVIGKLADQAHAPLDDAGVLLSSVSPGTMTFRLTFEAAAIYAAEKEGPYLLSEIELLDGERGFVRADRLVDAHTTAPYQWTDFGGGADFIRGDANDDGTVDLTDAVSLLEFLFLGTRELNCRDAGNSNGDGDVDVTDGINILNKLFVGTGEIPAPYPGCGEANLLGCDKYENCP